MHDPEEYAHRVRTHPFGPVETVTGALVVWLHGPYVVISVGTAPGPRVAVTGSADDETLPADLVEFFDTAAAVGEAELAGPGRLLVDQPAGGVQPVRARRPAVATVGDRDQIVVDTSLIAVTIAVDRADLAVQAQGFRVWAEAMTAMGKAAVTGSRPPDGGRP